MAGIFSRKLSQRDQILLLSVDIHIIICGFQSDKIH
jgi:hypothetical protein